VTTSIRLYMCFCRADCSDKTIALTSEKFPDATLAHRRVTWWIYRIVASFPKQSACSFVKLSIHTSNIARTFQEFSDAIAPRRHGIWWMCCQIFSIVICSSIWIYQLTIALTFARFPDTKAAGRRGIWWICCYTFSNIRLPQFDCINWLSHWHLRNVPTQYRLVDAGFGGFVVTHSQISACYSIWLYQLIIVLTFVKFSDAKVARRRGIWWICCSTRCRPCRRLLRRTLSR